MNPTQKLEFLGFMVDTKTMKIALPPHKIDAIQKEASQLLSAGSIQIRTLAHFIVTLVATKPVVPLGPLHFQALQDLKTPALICHQATYQSLVQLSQAAQTDLQWWITQSPLPCSTTILRTEALVVTESDASRLGWGAVCQEVHTGGTWTPSELNYHINYLKLKGAFLALQSSVKEMSNIGILIRMDDRTAITYINKMGGPAMSQLCCLALQIWQWCQGCNITLHAEYLPGKDNTKTDWESCHLRNSSDWKLLPSVFRSLNSLLGPFTIDLFASRTNAQLPQYYSWKPDQQPEQWMLFQSLGCRTNYTCFHL